MNLQVAYINVFERLFLTHEVPLLPSYRNKLIDLLCKSIDWFLYESNKGT